MNTIYALIEQWVLSKQIPSAVIQINANGKVIAQKAFGHATMDTMYDIASLTKVTATLPSLMLLEQAGQLSLTDKISKYLPQFPHKQITLQHCLLHLSGLPGSLPYPQDRYATEDVLQKIMALPLLTEPEQETRYSDVGIVLVGKVIEAITDQTLAQFAKKEVFQPLGMNNTQFVPPQSIWSQIAPTEWNEKNKAYIQGEVHDEVSYKLGGISGSAGVFSTAADLSQYAQMWLFPEQFNVLAPQTIQKCLANPIASRGLGWQVQDFSGASLACGMNWTKGSYGHTGFTGTSLWIEPFQKLSVVFLTNAVHYGRNTNIVELRKQLHDEIYHSLLKA